MRTERHSHVLSHWRLVLALGMAAALLFSRSREVAAEPPAVQAPAQGELKVHVVGFADARGHLIAKLFRQGEKFSGPGFLQVTAEIHEKHAHVVFPAVPYGDYALMVFQDVNDNGTLDHNFLHIPAEPMGFSNGFSPSLSSPMPTFEKLRFTFGPGFTGLNVQVK